MAKGPDGERYPVLLDPPYASALSRYSWRINNDGYCYRPSSIRRPDGKTWGIKIYMHRVIARAPQHLDVHHKNFNRTDNRTANLQLMHPSANRALHRGT